MAAHEMLRKRVRNNGDFYEALRKRVRNNGGSYETYRNIEKTS